MMRKAVFIKAQICKTKHVGMAKLFEMVLVFLVGDDGFLHSLQIKAPSPFSKNQGLH